jgi:hypothetical protein
MTRRRRTPRLPHLGDIAVILPPRVTADGVTVVYADDAELCVVCRLPCYVRVDGIALHTDRCLDHHRRTVA